MSELIAWVCECGILNSIKSKYCAVCKAGHKKRLKVY